MNVTAPQSRSSILSNQSLKEALILEVPGSKTSISLTAGRIKLSRDGFADCVRMASALTTGSERKAFAVTPASDLSYNTTYQVKTTTDTVNADALSFF